MTQSANPSFSFHTVAGWRRAGLHALGKGVRAWQNSLHYQGLEEMARVLDRDVSGALLLFWHNRLFSVIGAFKQLEGVQREVFGLVSASRDGAQLAHFLESQGIRTVRGSSSRRGAAAARQLLGLLADGNHVVITVDGPRGPCYQAQPGAALLLQLTGAPVCCLGAEAENARELRSWDRFILPMPFSRVKIKLDRFALPEPSPGKEQRQAIQAIIQNRLSRLTADIHRQA
jgi:lysophospholipid acyltransferase (LPLAT)-like uncharacterized protein